MYTEIKLADWRKLKNKTGLYTVDFNDIEYGYHGFSLNQWKESIEADSSARTFVPGKFYYKDSYYHNETGPARILVTGEKQYWFEGKWYKDIKTDKQWVAFVKTV